MSRSKFYGEIVGLVGHDSPELTSWNYGGTKSCNIHCIYPDKYLICHTLWTLWQYQEMNKSFKTIPYFVDNFDCQELGRLCCCRRINSYCGIVGAGVYLLAPRPPPHSTTRLPLLPSRPYLTRHSHDSPQTRVILLTFSVAIAT